MRGLRQQAVSGYLGLISVVLAAAAFISVQAAWAEEEGDFGPDTYNPVITGDFNSAYSADYASANNLPGTDNYNNISGIGDYGAVNPGNISGIPTDAYAQNAMPFDAGGASPSPTTDYPAVSNIEIIGQTQGPEGFAPTSNVEIMASQASPQIDTNISPDTSASNAAEETSGDFFSSALSSVGDALSSVGSALVSVGEFAISPFYNKGFADRERDLRAQGGISDSELQDRIRNGEIDFNKVQITSVPIRLTGPFGSDPHMNFINPITNAPNEYHDPTPALPTDPTPADTALNDALYMPKPIVNPADSGGFWSSVGDALSSVGGAVVSAGEAVVSGGETVVSAVARGVYSSDGGSLVNNAATRLVKDTVTDAFSAPDNENYPSAGKQFLAAASTILAPLSPVVPFAGELKGAMELSPEQYKAYKEVKGSVPYVLRPVGTEGTISHDVFGISNEGFYPTPSYIQQGFNSEADRSEFISGLNSGNTVSVSIKNDSGVIAPTIEFDNRDNTIK